MKQNIPRNTPTGSMKKSESVSRSVMPDSSQPHGLQDPTRLLCPWDFPGKNTGLGSHSLLRGDLPDPGFEPRSLTMQQILYHLSHQGSSNKLSHGAQGQKMQAGLPQLKIVTGMLLEQSYQKSLSFASLMPHNLYLYHTYLFSGSYLYLSPHFAIMDASKERSHSLNFQVLVLQSLYQFSLLFLTLYPHWIFSFLRRKIVLSQIISAVNQHNCQSCLGRTSQAMCYFQDHDKYVLLQEFLLIFFNVAHFTDQII